MIFYLTKKTIERYKIQLYDEITDTKIKELSEIIYNRDKDNRLFEWGVKIFYFEGRKSLEVINFASKLTFFIVDIKMSELVAFPNYVAQFLLDLYSDNEEMTELVKKYFTESPVVCYDRLTDKSAIASLNSAYRYFLSDGYKLYDYIQDGIMHTRKLNKDVNKRYPVTMKIDGKTDYIFPAKYFEQLLKERYNQ